ncbi:major facilitator superfamily transporter [Diaporthe amygdali]|uniref:major facilitator superfamily transporter n=1 Tax=Phomopsis amygdali TaxID=1214568 RepID=UPI0022FE85DA|nr:major facilitator superfamily transporter [Diaporthe amygdali]KAJ0119718.1 major facilitator superfamily transporter [Diaporthe amygdali]
MGFFQRDSKQQPETKLEVVDESLRQETEWKPTTHQLMIMVALSVISFMVSLDACIIVTSLSAIVEDLGGTATQSFWVGTAYLLSTSVAMPFLASISDIFGRPILLIFSIIMFTIGSIICATAPDIATLLGGRSIQGIGGGGIIVLSLVIFTDIVPLRQRPKWYGTVQGAWALGNCVGPVLGGAIADGTTWRWVFYVMFPFCAFGLISIPFLLTLKPKVETLGQKLARVDWIGSAIFMTSATLFLIAISWGGTQFEWSSAATIAPLLVGAIGLLGTAAWEKYMAKEPFLKHSLFYNVSAISTFICSAAQGLVLFGQLYYVPFYFMSVLAYSPIHTGLALLPVMLTLVPGSIITGVLITRWNGYRWPIWSGWVVTTIGCGLTTMWDEDTPIGIWVVTLILLGFGHGAILNAQNFASQAICKDGEEAAAAAMYGFLRHFGTALGVGIGGSAFQNIMALKLSWTDVPGGAEIAKNAEAFIVKLLAMPSSPEKDQIIDGYVFGFRGVYSVYLGISGVAFFISLLIRHYDMNKELLTDHQLQDNNIARIMDKRLSSYRNSRMDTSTFAGLKQLDVVQESPQETLNGSRRPSDAETRIGSGTATPRIKEEVEEEDLPQLPKPVATVLINEIVKTESPKTEVAKAETVTAEEANAQAAKSEAAKPEATKPEAVKSEETKPENTKP